MSLSRSLAQTQLPGSRAAARGWRSTTVTQGRVMIVDDDQAFVDAVAIYLEDHGFWVLKAYTGLDGITAAQRVRIDLAIIDVHLPDVEGPGVAQALQESQPATPVLLISSDDSPGNAARCLASNVHAFMAKPLIPKQFLDTIFRLCMPGKADANSPSGCAQRT